MAEREDRPLDELVRPVAEQPAQRRVDLQDGAGGVDHRHADRGAVEHGLETGLAGPAGVLRAHPGGERGRPHALLLGPRVGLQRLGVAGGQRGLHRGHPGGLRRRADRSAQLPTQHQQAELECDRVGDVGRHHGRTDAQRDRAVQVPLGDRDEQVVGQVGQVVPQVVPAHGDIAGAQERVHPGVGDLAGPRQAGCGQRQTGPGVRAHVQPAMSCLRRSGARSQRPLLPHVPRTIPLRPPIVRPAETAAAHTSGLRPSAGDLNGRAACIERLRSAGPFSTARDFLRSQGAGNAPGRGATEPTTTGSVAFRHRRYETRGSGGFMGRHRVSRHLHIGWLVPLLAGVWLVNRPGRKCRRIKAKKSPAT